MFLIRNNTSFAISLGEIFPILSGTINFFALIFGQAKNLFFFKYKDLTIKVRNLFINEIFTITQKMIVPERIGNISPREIAREVLFLIKNKDKLKSIRNNLRKERGDKGAAEKLASIIINSIKKL